MKIYVSYLIDNIFVYGNHIPYTPERADALRI